MPAAAEDSINKKGEKQTVLRVAKYFTVHNNSSYLYLGLLASSEARAKAMAKGE